MFFFISLISVRRFHIKLQGKCKFLGGPIDEKYPRAVKPQYADILNADTGIKDGFITDDSRLGKVFEIDYSGELYTCENHNNEYQYFTFNFLPPKPDGELFFSLKNRGQCVRYVENENLFRVKECNLNDPMQVFEYRDNGDVTCITRKEIDVDYVLNRSIPEGSFPIGEPRSYVNGLVAL